MKKFRKSWYFFLFFILLIWLWPQTVSAESAGYGVTPILPDNQLTEDSFFNLLVTPDATQELNIQLTNQSQQDKTLQLIATTATTTQQGTINYIAKPKLNQGPVLSELLTLPEKVVLAANETKVVSLTLKLPAKSFTGILLGAITIQEITPSSDTAGITNQFAYQIGVMLRESKDLPKQDVTLSQLTTTHQQVQLTVKNSGRLVSGTLTGKWSGKNQPTFSQKIQLAPNTSAAIPLPFEDKLASGGGTLTVTLKTADQTFTYQQHLYLRKTATGFQLIKLPIPWHVILSVGGVILAVVIATIWYWRKKKHNKKTSEN